MNNKLNDDIVMALTAPAKGNEVTYYAGAKLQGKDVPSGFGVRVSEKGVKSFVLRYRNENGTQRVYTIGKYKGSGGDYGVFAAIVKAVELRKVINQGEDPLQVKQDKRKKPEKTKTVADVIDDFIEKYVKNKERPLRSASEYERALNNLVKPCIGTKGIYELDRGHVAKMLDQVEKDNGPVMADRSRAYLRKALGWWAERDPVFNLNQSIVKVTPRANAKQRARERVLSDDEIRIVWHCAGEAKTFGNMVKMLLLTGARRDEVAGMSLKELSKDGVFTVPAERCKIKKPHAIPLSATALAIIEEQKKISKCDYVFSSSAKTKFSAYGKSKAALDEAILAEMLKENEKAEALPRWTLHDLRRSAKTLMVRAGVSDHVSERVIGHAISGVASVYDRHSYEQEKRDALETLARMVERILNPAPSNVVALDKKRGRK